MNGNTRPADGKVERIIGALLRVGVITAALVACAGGIWRLAEHGNQAAEYAGFRGEPEHLTSVAGILRAAASLQSDAIIQLGVLLLISVPILRVIVSVIAFALERDWLYVAVTVMVLAILAMSLFGGLG
jgi:uncharacterized membrane protein